MTRSRMNRLLLFASSLVVGLGLYFDAVVPLGLNTLAVLAIGVGTGRALCFAPAFSFRWAPPNTSRPASRR